MNQGEWDQVLDASVDLQFILDDVMEAIERAGNGGSAEETELLKCLRRLTKQSQRMEALMVGQQRMRL